MVSFDLAIDYFTASIDETPPPPTINARGMVRLEQGELDLALCDFDDAIRLDSNLATAYNGRGVRTRPGASSAKRWPISTRPSGLSPVRECLRQSGVVSMAMGQFEKAMADYDEAIRLNPR